MEYKRERSDGSRTSSMKSKKRAPSREDKEFQTLLDQIEISSSSDTSIREDTNLVTSLVIESEATMDTITEDSEDVPQTAASRLGSASSERVGSASSERVGSSRVGSRIGSGRLPTHDGKAAFNRTRTPGTGESRVSEPELPEGSTEVLITELKGTDAEQQETDILHLDNDDDVDLEFGEDSLEEVTPEPEVDDEERKWKLLNSAEDWDTDLEVEDEDLYDIHDTTGRSKYLKTCENLGVVPCSYFMRHIQDAEIVMKYHGLGPNGTRAVAKVMKDNITVERLNLEGNWMEAEGARHMAKMLGENDYITHVSLSGNRLGSEGAESISAMLENNHTLKTIDLSGNFFEDKDAECLSDAIEKNRNLQNLNLADNKFGSEAGEWLGPAIGANDNIVRLDLSWNQIRASGAKAVAAGLKENVRLKYCNLSWNGFGSEGGCAILDAMMANQSIEEIDISGNRLDDECAKRAAKLLQTTESLEILRMGKNPITTTGAVTIIGVVLKNEQSSIKVVDLSDIPVEYEFMRISEELERSRGVKVIHGPILRSGNTPDDIGKPSIDPYARHPLLILKEHILVNDNRIVTALQKHDPDNTLCVNKDQFMEALDELEIKYWRSQIDDVAKKLDKYHNNTIYYGDFIPPEGPKREPALGMGTDAEP